MRTPPISLAPESDLGKAISLLSQGLRLPNYLVTELREQGYDIPGLHNAYLNKKD